jgi:hypothetical protein
VKTNEPMSAEERVAALATRRWTSAVSTESYDVVRCSDAVVAAEAHAAAAVERELERVIAVGSVEAFWRQQYRAERQRAERAERNVRLALELAEEARRERDEARDAFAVSAAEAERTIARLTSERDEARADAAQVRCKFLNIERDLHSRLVHTESALAAERAARAAYQSLAEGLDKLCISYRMGSRPSGATLDKITKTREQLAALAPRAENPT